MDHSIQAYLNRRTTEELNHILKTTLAQENEDWNAEVIQMILDILRKRERESEQP